MPFQLRPWLKPRHLEKRKISKPIPLTKDVSFAITALFLPIFYPFCFFALFYLLSSRYSSGAPLVISIDGFQAFLSNFCVLSFQKTFFFLNFLKMMGLRTLLKIDRFDQTHRIYAIGVPEPPIHLPLF